MPKPVTEISDDNLRLLAGCLDNAANNLNDLRDQLSKIIEAKKRSSTQAGSAMFMRQVSDVLNTIENLEKIGSILPGAINDVQQLCNQARQLLVSHHISAGPAAPGLGAASANEEEDDDDKR